MRAERARVGGAAGLALCAYAGVSAAQPAAPPPPNPAGHRADPAMARDAAPPHYFLRAGLGLGGNFGSDHADLLASDGYDLGTRAMFITDVAYFVTRDWGLGAFLSFSDASADPGGGAPVLHRSDTFYLAQVTAQSVSGAMAMTLALRGGLADSSLSLYDGSGTTRTSFAAGLEVGAIVLPAHVGLGFGVLWAPRYTPSELGRSYQIGGYYFAISGVFHD